MIWIVLPLVIAGVAALFCVFTLLARRRRARAMTELIAFAEELCSGRWRARWAPHTDVPADIVQLGERLNEAADTADRKIETLRARNTNLKLLVDALPDPILLSDERDRIVLINAPAERLLRLPPQQVIGQPFVAAVNDPSILDLFEQCTRLRDARAGLNGDDAATKPIDREIKLMRKGNRLSFQAHAEPTRTGGMLVVLRDVSTLAATVQMKTDFVANASHELRTPISAIKVAFETLREVYRDEDESLSDRCITIIDGHLRRLEEMLRDLLDLSRVESADLKPLMAPVRSCDLIAMLRSIWSPIAREKGVELSLPEPAASEEFISDRRLLELVLKNLVENAIKFTPGGGKVSVSVTRSDSLDAPTITLRVADTGCGIPREHADRVFERFYQVDSARSGTAGRGTGLGLAIVKHAVNALGGQVTLESDLGRGTTITCTLPQ